MTPTGPATSSAAPGRDRAARRPGRPAPCSPGAARAAAGGPRLQLVQPERGGPPQETVSRRGRRRLPRRIASRSCSRAAMAEGAPARLRASRIRVDRTRWLAGPLASSQPHAAVGQEPRSITRSSTRSRSRSSAASSKFSASTATPQLLAQLEQRSGGIGPPSAPGGRVALADVLARAVQPAQQVAQLAPRRLRSTRRSPAGPVSRKSSSVAPQPGTQAVRGERPPRPPVALPHRARKLAERRLGDGWRRSRRPSPRRTARRGAASHLARARSASG